MSFAILFKIALQWKGITQHEFATERNLNPVSVNHFLTGRSTSHSVGRHMERYATKNLAEMVGFLQSRITSDQKLYLETCVKSAYYEHMKNIRR